MTSVELVVGAVAAIALALGFLCVAYSVAGRLCRTCDTLTRWVGIVAVLAWLPTALFHLLAVRHAFLRPVAVGAVTLLAAAAWYSTGGALMRRWLERDRVFIGRVASRLMRSPYRVAVAAFVAFAMPPLLRAVILPPLGWDTLTYHSVKAATWVQHGGADRLNGIGPWAYYRNMPGGAEVLLAWAMLPLSSDALTGLVDIMEWLAVGLSTMVLARRLGVREPFASTAAGFVMAMPVVRLMLGSGYSELCLLSTFVSGLALGLAADRTRPGVLMLAGGALGVAAATKLPMIVVTAVPLLFLAVRFLINGPERRAGWLVAMCLAYGAALVPWLAYAIVDTGAPLSPAPITLGPLVLGKAPPELIWYVDRHFNHPLNLSSELAILGDVFSSPFATVDGAGLLALIPIAGMWLGVWRLWRRQRFGIVLLLGATIGCLAMYYSPSFLIIRHAFSTNSSRFLLPALTIGVLLGVSWCRRGSLAGRGAWTVLMLCIVWNLVRYAFVGFSRTSIYASVGVLGAVVLLGAMWYGISSLDAGALRRGLAAAVAILSLVALQRSRDALRDPLLQSDFTLHWFAEFRYWAPSVALVDDPNTKYRIAVTSGPRQNNDHWFVYPFMGRRLQNEILYVPISGDGRTHHFGRAGLNEELVQTANVWAWHERLLRQKVTHVLTFGPTSPELNWMEADPENFERIEGMPGDSWGIFRVKSSR